MTFDIVVRPFAHDPIIPAGKSHINSAIGGTNPPIAIPGCPPGYIARPNGTGGVDTGGVPVDGAPGVVNTGGVTGCGWFDGNPGVNTVPAGGVCVVPDAGGLPPDAGGIPPVAGGVCDAGGVFGTC